MEKKLRITASEARKITEESNYLLNKTYKWIADAAKENYTFLEISVGGIDTSIVNHIENTLKEDGYTVTRKIDIRGDADEYFVYALEIKW